MSCCLFWNPNFSFSLCSKHNSAPSSLLPSTARSPLQSGASPDQNQMDSEPEIPSMQSSGSNLCAARQKSDPTWEYASEGVGDNGKRTITCVFCHRIFKGGGISRVKMHLAGKRGDVGPCKKVPPEVRYKMEKCLNETKQQKLERQANFDELNPFRHGLEGDVPYEYGAPNSQCKSVNESGGSTSTGRSGQKRKVGEIGNYFPSGTKPGSQPCIKAALQTKERVRQVDLAIVRFVYDTCIPMNVANSFYYQPTIDAVASIGLGYKAPSYYALRVTLLNEAKKEVKLLVETFRSTWATTGCTIMGDDWKDERERQLINFLVYRPKGITFLKSIDASDFVTDAETLCNLFSEIVDIIGPRNVVHLVTDNASNYKKAGRLISEKYRNTAWSPCAAHCLNLILKDIAEMSHVERLAQSASKLTKFVYNHKWTNSWLRRRPSWREVLHPGETRFATTFITLKSLYDRKLDFQAMFTSDDYHNWRGSRVAVAKASKSVALDEKFWNDCLIVSRIVIPTFLQYITVGPLMRLLRLFDSDEKRSLGYVYDGMLRARRGIKEIFQRRKRLYRPYINIIKNRWDTLLRKDIHAAAYWLNPAFQYDKLSGNQKLWQEFWK